MTEAPQPADSWALEAQAAGAPALAQRLRRQAHATPHRVAVRCGNVQLTFAELVERSARVAAVLQAHGATADTCVGVCAKPSLDLAVSVWGVVFSGAAYVPLPHDYPEERVAGMIQDAGVGLVLHTAQLRGVVDRWLPAGAQALSLQQALHGAPRAGRDAAAPVARPTDLAYVIYTSGSTGRPKGVMIESHSIAEQMDWLARACGIGAQSIVLQKTPMSFDAAQWELLAPACGAQIVMTQPGDFRDPEALVAAILRYRVNTLQCVPTLLQALVECDGFAQCHCLLHVFCGGEALAKSLAEKLLAALPTCSLTNLYGPTECTINTSAYRVEPEQLAALDQAIPVGKAADTMAYAILDEGMAPVARGSVGELLIAGSGLARGYLNLSQLTQERFVRLDLPGFAPRTRFYRSGDLAMELDDGDVVIRGRKDSQVKVNGHRVELEEVRLALEAHTWVRHAAAAVEGDALSKSLVAYVELNPHTAALMDQGLNAEHHQSKASRAQVAAQLSHAGVRAPETLGGQPIGLPGKAADQAQARAAFSRKTYRFYEGAPTSQHALERLLAGLAEPVRVLPTAALSLAVLGQILRYLGPILSEERLLPKYAYASPGALYATQLVLEAEGVAGLRGHYYFHPWEHALYPLATGDAPRAGLRLHFVGKTRAVEPIYRKNIQEVLSLEAGHMAGLLDHVLAQHGYGLGELEEAGASSERLKADTSDVCLGCFTVRPGPSAPPASGTEIYAQAHAQRVEDMSAGLHRLVESALAPASLGGIEQRDVIAINQEVYERAAVGVAFVRGENEWRDYVALGRVFQHMQMNAQGLGFMSAGYSSKTQAPLPSAARLRRLLRTEGASYFGVGGPVSAAQQEARDMKEDAVHMRGPAEMLREDLKRLLPEHMIPSRIALVSAMPLTAHGKVDLHALRAMNLRPQRVAPTPPATAMQRRVADIWREVLRQDEVSVTANFFACGGNSLLAVALVNRINRALGSALPTQALFLTPTIEALARAVEGQEQSARSRLVPLNVDAPNEGQGRPVFCWPGLGGYCAGLQPLAQGLRGLGRPILGVQGMGLNAGETPFADLHALVQADLELVKYRQGSGPYTLVGYSFGARVAYEVACRLEEEGAEIERLVLLAPGMPTLAVPPPVAAQQGARYDSPHFVALLFSVFARRTRGDDLQRFLREVRSEQDFLRLAEAQWPAMGREVLLRVCRLVSCWHQAALEQPLPARLHGLQAPLTLLRAQGDLPSFMEQWQARPASSTHCVTVRANHFDMLNAPHAWHAGAQIASQLAPLSGANRQMPHISIKHFPKDLSAAQETVLIDALTQAITKAFGCADTAVSIAMEAVSPQAWEAEVYTPEIAGRRASLRKLPGYGSLAAPVEVP